MYIEIALQKVFLITLLNFAQYLLKIACKIEKVAKVAYKITGNSKKYRTKHIRMESCKKVVKFAKN